MSKLELKGKVLTVLGPVDPEDLGITLTHEHLFIDMSPIFIKPESYEEMQMAYQPVCLENRWWIYAHHLHNLDDTKLMNRDVAVREAMQFKCAGGGTIVDASNIDIGRDPLGLAYVAQTTGLNVIMGSGRYVDLARPADMGNKSEEDICEEIVKDVMIGVGDTGIRAGFIGEIGCTWPLTKNERKVLVGAALAQQRTGAALSIHPGRHPEAPFEILEILIGAGADMKRTIIDHIDRTLRKPEERLKLAESGCYLEYDLFGLEGYYPLAKIDLPNDHQRINEIIHLIEHGHLKQILISHDICSKVRQKSYGGHGRDHILRNAVPVMRDKGISGEQIDTMLIDNPRRLLTFV